MFLSYRARQQPQNTPVLDLGNPLLRGAADVILPHHARTLMRGVATQLTTGSGTGSASIRSAASGMAVSLNTGTQAGLTVGDSFALFGQGVLPGGSLPTECTIFIYRRSRDTIARNTVLFGYSTTTADRVLISAPFGDGVCYWDFGSTATGAGGKRISVAFTKTTQPETLVFIAGSTRGREIWRNGTMLVGDATVNGTLNTGLTRPVGIGPSNADTTSSADNDEVYLAGSVGRAWSPAEIREWSANPWGIFTMRRRLWVPGPPSTSTARPQVFICT